MDLRSLIEKLDTIEQQKLLTESQQLMEKVGLRLQDIEAKVGRIIDPNERAAAIGKIATDAGYSGLFDPNTGKFVNANGKFASIGAYQAEVERLRDDGLIPNSAKTSSALGFMGSDEKDAKPASNKIQDLLNDIDKADELITKAISESTNIAESLLAEFGINTTIIEAITPEEHQFIKKTVQASQPLVTKGNRDAVELVTNFKAYNRERDQLIARIKEIIATLSSAPAGQQSTPAAAPQRQGSSATQTNESLQESKNRMIAEGRVIVLEDGTFLKDGQKYLYNEEKDTYYYHDDNGVLVEYSAGEFWQDVKDTGRGVTSGALMGLQDPILAKAYSMIKGTNFHDELKKQIATTDAARQRSPWLYTAGAFGGWALNPLTKTPVGAATMAATTLGAEVFRPEINQYMLDKSKPDGAVQTQPAGKLKFDPKVQKLQRYLISVYGPDAVGKFKDDGKLGPDTQKAIERAKKDGKLPGGEPAAQPAAQTTSGPGTMTTADGVTLTPEMVQAKMKELGITGTSISPEQLEKLAASLGIKGEANESAELNNILRLAGTEQLNEFGELIGAGGRFLRGLVGAGSKAAPAADAAASATRAAPAAADVAATATRAADTVPSVVNLGGKTWEKVGNNFKVRGGQEVMSVDDMMLKLGKIEGPNAQALRTQDAVNNMVRRGATATDDVAATVAKAEPELVSKFGNGAKTMLDRAKGFTGRLAALARNPKFLTLLAILGAIGVLTSSDNQPVNPQPSPGPGPGPNTQPDAKEEEKKRKLAELDKLLTRLYGGWPTDAETAETIKAAIAAGAKGPEGFNPNAGTVNAQPASASSGSDRVFGGQGHAMSAQELVDAGDKNPVFPELGRTRAGK